MTTPAEKDAMALAAVKTAADALNYAGAKREGVQMVIDAHAHLAARVAAQAERIAQLEANETVLLRNFNRAEAELAVALDWVCHNGGLLNEWAKEWRPGRDAPLTAFIRAKLDAARGEGQ